MFQGKKVDIVIDYIQKLIVAEDLETNSQLPGENSIAEALQVSRVTVRRALANLQAAGYIYCIHGKGSFVQDRKPSSVQTVLPLIMSHGSSTSRFLELLSAMQHHLKEHNIETSVSLSERAAITEREYIEMYFEQGTRCLILIPVNSYENREFYMEMKKKGLSIIFVDVHPKDVSCYYVGCDNLYGGFLATEHLIKAGHKRIGFLSFENLGVTTSVDDRHAGYKLALSQYKIPYSTELEASSQTYHSLREALELLLALSPPPTAIFCSNDEAAIRVNHIFAEKNIKIPTEMAIIGFDNLPLCVDCYPSISTISQPFKEIGRKAAEMAYRLRAGELNDGFVSITLPVKLIARDSTRINK